MTTLRFPIAGVAALVHRANQAEEFEVLDPDVTGPALVMLVDEGIGLRTNAMPMSNAIVYAEGHNPREVRFEKWYAKRLKIWGKEPGYLVIPIAEAETAVERAGEWFEVEIEGPEDEY